MNSAALACGTHAPLREGAGTPREDGGQHSRPGEPNRMWTCACKYSRTELHTVPALVLQWSAVPSRPEEAGRRDSSACTGWSQRPLFGHAERACLIWSKRKNATGRPVCCERPGLSALAWGAGVGGIVAPPFMSWEALGKCLRFSELHFPHQSNGREQCVSEGWGWRGDWALPGARLGCAEDPDGSHLTGLPGWGGGQGCRAQGCSRQLRTGVCGGRASTFTSGSLDLSDS